LQNYNYGKKIVGRADDTPDSCPKAHRTYLQKVKDIRHKVKKTCNLRKN